MILFKDHQENYMKYLNICWFNFKTFHLKRSHKNEFIASDLRINTISHRPILISRQQIDVIPYTLT